jgi:superfamily II DNA or RNA helicase
MNFGPPTGIGGPDRPNNGQEGTAPVYPVDPALVNASLRPYQIHLLAEIDRALAAGCRRIMIQMPTGGGKTIVGAALIKPYRGLFTVPALSLIDQTVEKFFGAGLVDLGVIQADHPMTNALRRVQIASVQTLRRRMMPACDLVIIDEAHRWFDAYADWLCRDWAGVPVIGLSATPWTRGLGKYFDRLIIGTSTAQLIQDGYLSPFRVFAPASPDLSGVRTIAGDYHEGDLSEAMDKSPLVADVIDTWIDRAGSRPTFCFAVDRAHARHLQETFLGAGIPAAYIDACTEVSERRQIEREFHAGIVKVVCNVGCLTTGIDWDVRCIILARPTKSEMLFVRMVGRGLRTAPGKDHCLILDHSDNHTRLGFVTDIHHDALDDGRERPKAKPRQTDALPKKCPKCAYLKPPKVLACPCCGFIPVAQNTVRHREGELVEMTSRTTAVPVDAIRFYAELKHVARERGYKIGWPKHKFRERFGRWPDGLDHVEPVPPSRTTLSWIKSRQIAYAKAVKGAAWR